MSLVKSHYNLKPSIIVQRSTFYWRNQNRREFISDFVAELRTITEDCRYAAFLNDILRDKLVVEINDDAIQRRLLTEKDKMTRSLG